SNGSTSMASVCGSSLAMMDAGVPIKGQVAGIAMGLIKAEDNKVAVLSDIQGIEDALGDMDFKVAGTRTGVTAMQMDMKIKGIGVEVLASAIEQARQGRLFIMDKMDAAIAQPRTVMSQYAPRMITVQIHPDKIREVIGPGGKMIRKIIEDSGVASIDIEDDGRVIIGSVNGESAAKAEQIIRDLTGEVDVGNNYKGKVVRIMPFGAFVQIMPNQDGLVHISQLAEDRVERVEDAVQVGDEIDVKVTEVDRQGRVNLSRKAVLQEAKGITNGDWIVTERDRGGPPRSPGGGGFNRDRGGDRGPRRDYAGRGRENRN
ncbi:MAG: S1 RNA-binding domain-containing protein, partial [Chloroflexi bacterium]